MLRELTRKKLIQPLNNRQYVQVAKIYNGPGYAKNSYDSKLADADKHWARRLANTPLDRVLPPEQGISPVGHQGTPDPAEEPWLCRSRSSGRLLGLTHRWCALGLSGPRGPAGHRHVNDEATQAAIAEAVKRPVSPARKDITADELKEEGSPRTIATADNLSMFGKAKLWLAGVTGGGAIVDWISDGTMDTVQSVWDRVSRIPVSFILFIVFLAVSGVVVMWAAKRIKAYKVEDYASGRLS
jgi:N-acetylmuramidase